MKIFLNTAVIGLAVMILALFGSQIIEAQSWQFTNGPAHAVINDMTRGRAASVTTIYTADTSGVFKSTNAESTWTATASLASQPLVVACNDTSPTTVFAGINNYLMQSTDGGTSWRPNINNDVNLYPRCLAASDLAPGYMYLGLKKSQGNRR